MDNDVNFGTNANDTDDVGTNDHGANDDRADRHDNDVVPDEGKAEASPPCGTERACHPARPRARHPSARHERRRT